MSISNFDIPVLFLVFNRYSEAKRVFDRIREIKPNKLYIAADGPRNMEEDKKCLKVQSISELVDWDCEVQTLYRDTNLGCQKAVSSAIDWFFESEEMGIILEDDCLPSKSFFFYCEKMLHMYKDDEHVGMIGGNNFGQNNISSEYDIFFSKYVSIWGWATWKRAWSYFSLESDVIHSKEIEDKVCLTFGKFEGLERLKNYKASYAREISSWGYIWHYTNVINDFKCILPKMNLVTNVGFGEDATHTKSDTNANIKSYEMNLENLKTANFYNVNFDYEKHFLKSQFSMEYGKKLIKFILYGRFLKRLFKRYVK